MESTYAKQYRTLYEEHWWWRARERHVLDIIRTFDLPPEAAILDIGCGDALFFPALSAFGTPFGIEPDAALLSNHRWRDHIWNVPFDKNFQIDQRFDLILMLDVIEHINDDRSALFQAAKLLKPGGKILVTVPAMMSLWTYHDTLNQHHRRYTRSNLLSLFQSAELVCTSCRYYFIWTALPKALIHAKERLLGPPQTNAQTMIPAAPINALLTHFSYKEHRLLHAIPVPFGSSLIAVGSRQ